MKNEKSNMSGSKLTGQEISTYFRKNPKAKAGKKAVEFALDHGGAMNFAIKGIEKMKKGLSKHPEVKKALNYANFGESVARDTFNRIVTENYTKNFELLCQSLKFNKIQQKILDDFIHKGRIRDQYVGRVAGTKKEKRIFAGKKKFTGSIENRNTALMQALKVNAKQKSILDSYLKTGKVIGKYTGSIAGSTKTTKSYSGFRGFKEHFEIEEAKRYVKGGFTFKVEGKPKKGDLSPDTLLKGKNGKMWPSVKLVFVKSKDHWKATGSEKDLERMAWAVDQSKHLKRTSGRDEEGNLIKASVHESFKMPKPPKKDWYIEGIEIKFKDPKVRDALDDAHSAPPIVKDFEKAKKLAAAWARKNKVKFDENSVFYGPKTHKGNRFKKYDLNFIMDWYPREKADMTDLVQQISKLKYSEWNPNSINWGG